MTKPPETDQEDFTPVRDLGFSAVLSLASQELLVVGRLLREGITGLTNHDQAGACRSGIRKINAVWDAEAAKPPVDYPQAEEGRANG